MKYDVLTLFPEVFEIFNNYGVINKALEEGIIELNTTNIRDFSNNKHNKVDDEVYGGGVGMLMQCQPIYDALESVKKENSKVLFMSPQGKVLTQDLAKDLAKEEHLIILCGHYEGIDSRITNNYVDMEISIGDYILTGGEIPAMVLIDVVSRMIPGVLGRSQSYEEDSHFNLLLQHDEYTRPREFRGLEVPEVLISGNHEKIEQWQKNNSLENTKMKRPDIYKKYLELGGKNERN